ncbi:hypothetical protein D3C83_03310 [compost metagenome]
MPKKNADNMAMASTTAMTPMPIAMSRLMTGSLGGRGGCFMMSGSPFSIPSARAGAPSLTRFSHRRCTGLKGIGSPNSIEPKMIRISPALQASRKYTNLRMLE